MGAKTSERFSAKEVVRVLFKRKGLIISLFVIVSLGISVAVARQPARYEAAAKLLVKRSRSDLLLTPTDTRNVNFTLTVPQSQDLVAQAEFLRNRSLLEAVVKKLGLDQRAEAPIDAERPVRMASLLRMFEGLPSWNHLWPWSGGPSTDSADGGTHPLDDAVASIERNLTVRTIPNSNVIEVRFRTSDPGRAADIVNTLLTLYLDRYLEIQRTPGVAGFFTAQRDRIEQELRQAEEALAKFQQEGAFVDAHLQVEAYARRLAEARQNAIDARFDRREIEAKLLASQTFLATQPEYIVRMMTTRSNPLRRVMEERILTLEMERTKLLQKYTERDRRVTDIEAEIAGLKARLAAEGEWVADAQTSEINQQRRDTEEKVMASEVSLTRLRIKEEAWGETAAEMERRLADLALKGVAKHKLDRELKAHEEAYLLFRRKVEEARIHEAMDESKIMNISIAEMASRPMVPVGPKKDLSFMFAVMVGLVSGVGGAFVREFFDRSVTMEGQIASAVDVPVLASIPEEKNGGTKRNGKNGKNGKNGEPA